MNSPKLSTVQLSQLSSLIKELRSSQMSKEEVKRVINQEVSRVLDSESPPLPVYSDALQVLIQEAIKKLLPGAIATVLAAKEEDPPEKRLNQFLFDEAFIDFWELFSRHAENFFKEQKQGVLFDALLKKLAITQAALGKHTGISRQTINHIANNKQSLSTNTKGKILEYLKSLEK